MMRYCYFLLLALGLAACGSSENAENEDGQLANNFHLEGTITGAPLQKVTIEAASPNGTIVVAETMTNSNGKYVLDGNIPGMGVYSMTIGENPANAIVLPLDINDRAVISSSLADFPISPNMSGAAWAKPLMKYMQLFRTFSQAQMEQLPKITDDNERIKKYLELRKPLDAFLKKQVKSDPGNTVNLILASLLVPTQELGIQYWDADNLEVLQKMLGAYEKKHGDSPFTATLGQQVAQIEAQYNNYVAFNSGTLAAPEIAMKNPSGTELRLSSLKGKVVLIDFWASWCGPCRKENPNVVRMYKKFKSKGFEIFSVSLDKDPNAWKMAIEKDGLIWPNHVSDLMEWQTPLVQQYGFNSIPYTVLVNREGNIIGVNLRGEGLEQKLEEVLN